MTTQAEKDTQLANLDAVREFIAALPVDDVPPPPPPPPTGDMIDSEIRIGSAQVRYGDVTIANGARFVFEDSPKTHNESRLVFTGKVRRAGTQPVEFISENPNGYRGDVMVMGAAADVHVPDSNFVFRHMGRTRKDIPLDAATNPPARYAWHWHRCGFGTKHVFGNAKFYNSQSWSVVNHGSWAEVYDCEVHRGFGADFVSEVGDGQGGFYRCKSYDCDGCELSQLNTPNLNRTEAVGNMTRDGHVGRFGSGFWLDSPSVEVVDCEVYRSKSQPYFWFAMVYPEFDTGELPSGIPLDFGARTPLKRVENNYAQGCGGLELWKLQHPDNRFVNCTFEDCRESVVSGRFTANQTFEGLHATAAANVPPEAIGLAVAGPYGQNTTIRKSTSRRNRISGFPTGAILPTVGQSRIENTDFSDNGVDIEIWRASDVGFPNVLTFNDVGSPSIRWGDHGKYNRYPNITKVYAAMQQVFLDGKLLHWKQQESDYVLWDSEGYPDILRGKTNRHIHQEYGVAPSGVIDDTIVELPQLDARHVSGFPSAARHAEMPVGEATLYFRYLGVLRSESVIIKAGWQAFTFNYDDLKTTLFVQGI